MPLLCSSPSLITNVVRDTTLLNITRWMTTGNEFDNIVLTQPGGIGTPLVMTQTSDDATQAGIILINKTYTDVLVECEYVQTGWNTTLYADQIGPGAACRLTGTRGSADWNGYWCAQRLLNTPSRRVRPRRYAAGVAQNITSSVETSGLPAAWVDGTTHIISQIEAVGTSIKTRAKRLGQGSWEHEDLLGSDTTSASGSVGVWFQNFNNNGGTPQTITIHSFSVTEL